MGDLPSRSGAKLTFPMAEVPSETKGFNLGCLLLIKSMNGLIYYTSVVGTNSIMIEPVYIPIMVLLIIENR